MKWKDKLKQVIPMNVFVEDLRKTARRGIGLSAFCIGSYQESEERGR